MTQMLEFLDNWLQSKYAVQFSSVQQSHGLQHARLPCPSSTPGACSNSCPSNWWCHPAISSSVVPFSSCPQSCPASGSFPVSHFFISGGQRIGVSALASVFPKNTQDWSPLAWTGWISLQSKGLSRVFNTTVQKHQFFSASHSVQFSSVQLLSCVQLFATPWVAAHQASLSIPNSQSSLRFTSIESMMPSSHLILGRPLLLLPPIPPSIRVFSNESTLCMRGPKYYIINQ